MLEATTSRQAGNVCDGPEGELEAQTCPTNRKDVATAPDQAVEGAVARQGAVAKQL